jgi:hypothetical protein
MCFRQSNLIIALKQFNLMVFLIFWPLIFCRAVSFAEGKTAIFFTLNVKELEKLLVVDVLANFELLYEFEIFF